MKICGRFCFCFWWVIAAKLKSAWWTFNFYSCFIYENSVLAHIPVTAPIQQFLWRQQRIKDKTLIMGIKKFLLTWNLQSRVLMKLVNTVTTSDPCIPAKQNILHFTLHSVFLSNAKGNSWLLQELVHGELMGDQLTGPQCFYWPQVGTAQR